MADSCNTEGNLAELADRIERIISVRRFLILAIFSIAYFASTCYLAQRRLFWFDEIFTIAVSHLPSVATIWSACQGGADLNPPLFYLLTGWSQELFGMTELGARVPEIIGFWVFCLCLYRFVSLRANALAGFIAFLFPLTTTSYWYAYDARPHGIVLGLFGLALVSWQAAESPVKHRSVAVGLLCASLTSAAFCHCYAFILFIPLGIGELTRTVARRRIDVWVWLALTLPAVVSVLTVLPLLSTVHGSYRVTPIGDLLKHLKNGWDLAFDPALAFTILIILAATVALGLGLPKSTRGNVDGSGLTLRSHEIAALAAILGTPFFVFVAAWITKAPVYGRYSLIAVAGVACLIAFACARSNVSGLLCLSILACGVAVGAVRSYHGFIVVEPSTGLEVDTRLDDWKERFARMAKAADGTDPIVILNDLAFAPDFYYAPTGLRERLFYLTPDFNGEGYSHLQRYTATPGNIRERAAFITLHRTFYAYGKFAQADRFRQLGGQLTVVDSTSTEYLFRVVFPAGPQASSFSTDLAK